MDMNINVTIGETKELRETLEMLCIALQHKGPSGAIITNNIVPAKQETKLTPVIPVKQETKITPIIPTSPIIPVIPVTPSAPIIPAAPAAPVMTLPTATAKQYTLAEIQDACAPLVDAGKMEAISAIVQGFGVASIGQLPEDKIGELVIKLRALGAKL